MNRGEDDFSPTQVYFDEKEDILHTPKEVPAGKIFDPKLGENVPVRFGPPHIAMDQTFFPMQEGTRTKLVIKMAPTKFANVTYTWGWRKHPPRAQAVENSHKRIPPGGPELMLIDKVMTSHESWPDGQQSGEFKLPPFARLRIIDHERFVFDGLRDVAAEVARYHDKRNSHLANKKELRKKFEALSHVPFFQPIEHEEGGPISRLGDLAPAKRMWRVFRTIRQQLSSGPVADYSDCLARILDARDAFLDWKDRNHLPSGLEPDPRSDFTLLYANNTLYGESRHGGLRFDEWRKRGTDLKLTIINADYFLHGYINPDFGGSRGWENQFKPTLALGGPGSFFTFGRFHWRFNSEPGAVGIPPAVMVQKVQEKNGQYVYQDIVKPGKPTFLSPDGEPIYDGRLPDAVRPFVHRVMIRYNFEPSRRLRFYQFDPLHHDVNIYSIH